MSEKITTSINGQELGSLDTSEPGQVTNDRLPWLIIAWDPPTVEVIINGVVQESRQLTRSGDSLSCEPFYFQLELDDSTNEPVRIVSGNKHVIRVSRKTV